MNWCFTWPSKLPWLPFAVREKGLGDEGNIHAPPLNVVYQTIGMHRRMMTPMIPHLHITARSEQLLPTFSTSKSYHKCRFRTYCRTFVCKDQYRGMLRGIIAGQIDRFFPLPYRRVYNGFYYVCSSRQEALTESRRELGIQKVHTDVCRKIIHVSPMTIGLPMSQ